MSYRSDVAFTPAVKAQQQLRGSRDKYETFMQRRDWSNVLPEPLQAYVRARDSFYMSTASADGQPYLQHRGGPAGFVEVSESQLSFIDRTGNRQYISVGNLSENDWVMLFFMDYPNRRRLKVWGRAEVVELGSDERRIDITIEAWDLNCPKFITPRYTAEEWAQMREEG